VLDANADRLPERAQRQQETNGHQSDCTGHRQRAHDESLAR